MCNHKCTNMRIDMCMDLDGQPFLHSQHVPPLIRRAVLLFSEHADGERREARTDTTAAIGKVFDNYTGHNYTGHNYIAITI